jgi:hypothetical protein
MTIADRHRSGYRARFGRRFLCRIFKIDDTVVPHGPLFSHRHNIVSSKSHCMFSDQATFNTTLTTEIPCSIEASASATAFFCT